MEREPLIAADADTARSAVVVAASYLVTASLGGILAILIAVVAGEGAKTDSFLASYSVYLVFLLLGATLRATLIPLIGADRQRRGAARARGGRRAAARERRAPAVRRARRALPAHRAAAAIGPERGRRDRRGEPRGPGDRLVRPDLVGGPGGHARRRAPLLRQRGVLRRRERHDARRGGRAHAGRGRPRGGVRRAGGRRGVCSAATCCTCGGSASPRRPDSACWRARRRGAWPGARGRARPGRSPSSCSSRSRWPRSPRRWAR